LASRGGVVRVGGGAMAAGGEVGVAALQGTTGRGESMGVQRGLRRGHCARRPRRGTAGATGPRGGGGSATARTPASPCA